MPRSIVANRARHTLHAECSSQSLYFRLGQHDWSGVWGSRRSAALREKMPRDRPGGGESAHRQPHLLLTTRGVFEHVPPERSAERRGNGHTHAEPDECTQKGHPCCGTLLHRGSGLRGSRTAARCQNRERHQHSHIAHLLIGARAALGHPTSKCAKRRHSGSPPHSTRGREPVRLSRTKRVDDYSARSASTG